MDHYGNVSGSRPGVIYRAALGLAVLTAIGGLAFAAGLMWSSQARAEEAPGEPAKGKPRVVYPKETELDFEGMALEGELRSPGEFYFQYRPDEKMDSLVKRRKNFHREMLRDAVLSK
jgi:hypothetical protein